MTRSIDNLGAHLLGRKPMPRDDRDYRLADYLQAHESLVAELSPSTTLEELRASGPLEHWSEIYAFWAWFKAHIIGAPSPAPSPTPVPPAPAQTRVWQHGSISDQGQTPHCVGFTGLDWANCLPVNDGWPNSMGDTLYYACKVVDGEPQAEDGSNSRSLCKVLKQQARIGAYAFAKTADEAARYVLQHGPVGIGVDWYQSDFRPPAPGYVLQLAGGVAGGHEIMLSGYDTAARMFVLVNHWGAAWADHGCAYLRHDDLDKLLQQGGDCWAGLELPA